MTMNTNSKTTMPSAALLRPAIEAGRAWGDGAALDGVVKAIAREKPETLADVAVGLMLARDHIAAAADKSVVRKYRRKAMADARRLIDNALGVVAAASGIDLNDYGGDFYGLNNGELNHE